MTPPVRSPVRPIWLLLAGGAVLAVAAVRTLRRVAGSSMSPTYRPGELIVVLPHRRLRRGDVVVVRDPRVFERETLKRVVGLPGDAVELIGSLRTVPPGFVAVGGDNPASSTDSRHFGPVPARLVRGRVWPTRGSA